MADFTADDVAENAAKPASVSVTPTSTSAQQHNLRDQLEVADRKAASNASAKNHQGVYFQKIVAGGPNG